MEGFANCLSDDVFFDRVLSVAPEPDDVSTESLLAPEVLDLLSFGGCGIGSGSEASFLVSAASFWSDFATSPSASFDFASGSSSKLIGGLSSEPLSFRLAG